MSATRAGFRGDRWTNRRDEAVSLAAGVVFTVALLAVMAHFGRRTTMAPPVEIADLRVMTVPLEPPPPVVETPREPVETGMPLVGIEVGASDSPVRIAVVPPDLESLVPISAAPTATIQPLQLYSDLRPKVDLNVASDHIFQTTEVDRVPAVVVRPNPVVPSRVRRDAARLRVTVLFVVGTDGFATGLRVLKSSGNPEFDQIIVDAIQSDWIFSPALKHGKKVRCMTQQAVTVQWESGSPFNV